LGVNVGLCLPRSRLAAATARRPSTTSVASMTYHARVVSPAFGAYVGTALTTLSLRAAFADSDPGVTQVPVRRPRQGMISATDVDPSPGVPHANGAAYRRSSTQVKTRRRVAPLFALHTRS
jgi:hypothetical protein